MRQPRAFAVGCAERTRSGLGAAVGREIEVGSPVDLAAGDIVFFSASGTEGTPHGNAFVACRTLKLESPGVLVGVVVRSGDAVSEGIARFCGADYCVRIDDEHRVSEPASLAEVLRASSRVQRTEAGSTRYELSCRDPGRSNAAVRRMLDPGREAAFLDHLNDPETGLFNAQFASFKLDEEFKRTQRFHQPLSLVLVDIGGSLPHDASERRLVLAEMAGVFLAECRDIDVLARFTETVFMCLLPGTGPDGAMAVARRVLDELCGRNYSTPVRLMPAAGLTTIPCTGIADRSAFLAVAESALESARTDPRCDRLRAM